MPTTKNALLIGKCLYFFLYGAVGILVPYLNVYYKDTLHLSGTQIGMIGTLGPLIAIFSGPLWGLLSDRLGRMRLIMALAGSGAVAGAIGLANVESFGFLLFFTAVFNFFAGSLMPLVDSFNLALLGDQRERYGSQRIWGTFGFLATSSFAGSIIERTDLHIIFGAYVLWLGLFLVTLLGVQATPAKMGRAVFKGFAEMLRQPIWIVFGVSVVLVMIANNSWMNFLGVALKQMGSNDALVGQVWSIGAFAEIPVIWFGSRLLYRLGAKKMVALGFFFYGVRMLLYAAMPAPEWALAIGLLHSVSYGFYWMGGVNYVGQITPNHLRATGQSMLVTFFNIGSVIGAPLAGWVYDQAGPARLFLLAAFAAWIGLGVFVLASQRQR